MKNTKHNYLYNLAAAAVFAAMIFIVTAYLPRLPILGGAGGYVHLGDAVVYFAACLLPGPYAAVAAAAGGAMADLLTGFAVWAPASFVIKALASIAFSSRGVKIITLRNLAAALAAGAVTIAGYYVYEALIITDFAVAAAAIPFNALQALASAAVFAAAGFVCDRLKLKQRSGITGMP